MPTININEKQKRYTDEIKRRIDSANEKVYYKVSSDIDSLKDETATQIDTVNRKICKTNVNIDNTRDEILKNIDSVNRKVCRVNVDIDNLRNKFLVCVILTIASVIVLAITSLSCLYMENKLDAANTKIKYQAEQIEELEEEISGLKNNRETETEKLQQEINIIQGNLDFLNSLIRVKGE